VKVKVAFEAEGASPDQQVSSESSSIDFASFEVPEEALGIERVRSRRGKIRLDEWIEEWLSS